MSSSVGFFNPLFNGNMKRKIAYFLTFTVKSSSSHESCLSKTLYIHTMAFIQSSSAPFVAHVFFYELVDLTPLLQKSQREIARVQRKALVTVSSLPFGFGLLSSLTGHLEKSIIFGGAEQNGWPRRELQHFAV